MVKWIKKNMPMLMLICVVIIMLVITLNTNTVYGKLSENNMEGNKDSDLFTNIILTVSSVALGPIAGVLSGLVNVFNILVFIMLYSLFIGTGISGGAAFPFPDQIIFNKLAFFDPNFINPTNLGTSISAILQGLISGIYQSFLIIAGSVFVIAAMIIGIKLALSSIASEKAQYKKALMNWIVGILLLFTVHFLIAGIFAINEFVVNLVNEQAQTVEMEFEVNEWESIPFVGKPISSIISFIDNLKGNEKPTDDANKYNYNGYGGLIQVLLLKSIRGDFISSIICSIMLGQTLIIVIMYIKRLFYCMILGMLAPMVVVVDVLKKSMS